MNLRGDQRKIEAYATGTTTAGPRLFHTQSYVVEAHKGGCTTTQGLLYKHVGE